MLFRSRVCVCVYLYTVCVFIYFCKYMSKERVQDFDSEAMSFLQLDQCSTQSGAITSQKHSLTLTLTTLIECLQPAPKDRKKNNKKNVVNKLQSQNDFRDGGGDFLTFVLQSVK